MRQITRIARRSLVPLAALALFAGCRDRATSAPPVDSSLTQDLAMAQRPGSGPAVFNDAPVGATLRRLAPGRADA